MNQSFDTVLQVVQRALGETVLPALGGADKHVVEQLQLSLAALGFLQARLPHARAFYRRELTELVALGRDARDLGEQDSSLGQQLSRAAESASAMLNDPVADTSDYIVEIRRLRELLAELVEASTGLPFEAALDALILSRNEKMQTRARAWCEPFGFELAPLGADTHDW